MQVIVQTKTLPVTQALRTFVERQSQKLTKLGLKINKVVVYLENVARRTSDPHRSEVRYRVEVPGKDVVVEKKGNDLYTAITEASLRMVRQLSKLKERHLRAQRQSLSKE